MLPRLLLADPASAEAYEAGYLSSPSLRRTEASVQGNNKKRDRKTDRYPQASEEITEVVVITQELIHDFKYGDSHTLFRFCLLSYPNRNVVQIQEHLHSSGFSTFRLLKINGFFP